MILNVIIFQYEEGLGKCLGVWVNIFRVCGYAFYNLESRKLETAPEPPVSHYLISTLLIVIVFFASMEDAFNNTLFINTFGSTFYTMQRKEN